MNIALTHYVVLQCCCACVGCRNPTINVMRAGGPETRVSFGVPLSIRLIFNSLLIIIRLHVYGIKVELLTLTQYCAPYHLTIL